MRHDAAVAAVGNDVGGAVVIIERHYGQPAGLGLEQGYVLSLEARAYDEEAVAGVALNDVVNAAAKPHRAFEAELSYLPPEGLVLRALAVDVERPAGTVGRGLAPAADKAVEALGALQTAYGHGAADGIV